MIGRGVAFIGDRWDMRSTNRGRGEICDPQIKAEIAGFGVMRKSKTLTWLAESLSQPF